MEVKDQDVIVFMPNGVTFRFQKVTYLEVDGDKIKIAYEGVSTGQKRIVNFTGIAGYSALNK